MRHLTLAAPVACLCWTTPAHTQEAVAPAEPVTSEARRLFYVGITRAQFEVHLVHTAGRASPFVTEIKAHLDALEGR